MSHVKRGILSAVAVGLLAMLAGATPAIAASPWWHLTTGSQPSNLHSGSAQNEVQEIIVSATAGEYILFSEEKEGAALFKFDATPEELQEGLEGIYGAGNIEVTGGPGNEAGDKPYVVSFKGEQSHRPLQLLSAFSLLEGGKAEATVSEVSKGAADGKIVLVASNLGDADADATSAVFRIVDKLPPGLKAVGIEAHTNEEIGTENPLECSIESLSCTFASTLPPYDSIEVIIPVVVEEGAKTGELNEVSASGGGAPSTSISRPIKVDASQTPFGVEALEMMPEEEGGAIDTQAGSHPFQLTTTLMLNQDLQQDGKSLTSPALPKDLRFKLPPGLVGNPVPFPQCTDAEFLDIKNGAVNGCPANTALGVAVAKIDLGGGPVTIAVPLFNLEPKFGEPARFGFEAKEVPVYLDTSVRTGEDYGVTVSVSNITQAAVFLSSEVTFWGVPGDPRHDNARGWSCLGDGFWHEVGESFGIPPCTPLAQSQPPPFLVLPTSCEGPLQTTVEADSWARPGIFETFPTSETIPGLNGCNRLPLTPSIKVTPDGQAASTPTGLTVDEHVPQSSSLAPEGLAESTVKGLSVTLPEGVVLNPSAADGLQACSLSEIGLQSAQAPSCPDAAKVATVKIKTPLLPNPLEGVAYLAAQNANPFGSLLALYVYVDDPDVGVRIKAAGEVLSDPVTGQLTAHFENNPLFEHDPRFAGQPAAQFLPQLPFEDVEVHFFGGARAPLGTPALCGGYVTTGTFTPWSGNATIKSSSEFQITTGPNGTPCTDPLPFAPSLTAGSTNIQAGAFTPFTTTLSREDGNQDLQAVDLHMPPGLSGLLSSVALCGEQQANAGTCGPGSLIGHTIVSVGLGGNPFSVTGGEVFITGPYKGAPFGLSIVNPAKAGPFDLGKVVVRAKIEVDRHTAELRVTTDSTGPHKIPRILEGIPLQIKHVNVTIDRSGFTFNPTNCNPLAIAGSLESVTGASSVLSAPFQVTNCATLKFAPKFTASVSGKASKANGVSLTAKLAYPKAAFGSQANIASVKVELPKQLPSRLTTLQKACLASVFEANPANCPAASIVGHATVRTPLLPVPLTGPAYFVSHGGEAFPSLTIVLQGYGVTVELVGSTFINKAGITSTTFKTTPDVPFNNFELTLPQGPNSALAANVRLCNAKLTMPINFVAQNGAVLNQKTPVDVQGCPTSLSIVSHSRRGRTIFLSVYVPSTGKLTARGKGLSRASRASKGRETVKLALRTRKAGKLTTQIKLGFTPVKGRKLSKTMSVKFGR